MPGVYGVTGEGPGQQAFTSAVYGNVPLMLTVLAILTFLLLARALRSLVLAAKAVILNVVSLMATFGILTWFWQDGHGSLPFSEYQRRVQSRSGCQSQCSRSCSGSLWTTKSSSLLECAKSSTPVKITNGALMEGLGRTGRLVTSAALILFLAFISLASAPLTDVKILATGLGIGILLDATIIRALLVPSLVVLFGRRNWWFPAALNDCCLISAPPRDPSRVVKWCNYSTATRSFPAGRAALRSTVVNVVRPLLERRNRSASNHPHEFALQFVDKRFGAVARHLRARAVRRKAKKLRRCDVALDNGVEARLTQRFEHAVVAATGLEHDVSSVLRAANRRVVPPCRLP